MVFPQELFAKIKCWNCSGHGHFYYRCPVELQHIFCRGCGQGDILFKYCVRCQENCKRGLRAGIPTSQNLINPNQKPPVEEAACNTDPEFYRILKRMLKRMLKRIC